MYRSIGPDRVQNQLTVEATGELTKFAGIHALTT